MATVTNPYESVKLTSSVDYKFLALLVADKLKNQKYKKEWKIIFLKSLFEELKPILSLEGIERLEKTVQDLFFQKQKVEKEKQAAETLTEAKKAVSRAEAKKSHVRIAGGGRDKFGNYLDEDLPSEEEDDDDY